MLIIFYFKLNGFDLIDVEIARQIAELEKGRPIIQETRGYDVAANQTFRLRTKETSTDYRYMPEADLPPLIITKVYHHLYSNLLIFSILIEQLIC